jgi:2-oxoglutarate dehydrogenase E1 component
MQQGMIPHSPVYAGNSAFIEELYEQYLTQPESVDLEWRRYFDGFRGTDSPTRAATEAQVRRLFDDKQRLAALTQASGTEAKVTAAKQIAVARLIVAYRGLGHFRAALDPIKLRSQPVIPDLDPAYHGLTEDDMDTVFHTGNLGGRSEMTLRELLEMLQETYTESIGVEFLHIAEVEEKRWLQTRLEATRTNPQFSAETKVRFLERLTAAEGLEQYLHQKFVGQKRFSLEGGEALVTALDAIIETGASQGLKEIVMGMAHRGRLNVLVNIMGKSPKELFEEFEGKHDWKGDFTGDVKYHQGHSADVQMPGGVMHLALGFNPSHLEIIDPVIEGSVRARQERRGDHARVQVMPVLIHGDAAFAGQGVVYETFNLSQTRGYSTGGTIHLVVNNRIGFTTSHPLDVRSMLYCTDVGKVVQAPIFHVNGDDPEAVAYIAQLAVNYRMTFKRDVVIDLVCYRRHGHNEADEPAATQPMMYKKIRSMPTTRDVYARRLEQAGVIAPGRAAELVKEYRDALEAGRQVAPNCVLEPSTYKRRLNFIKYRKAKWTDKVTTAIPVAEIRRLGQLLSRMPGGFRAAPARGQDRGRPREDGRRRAAGRLGLRGDRWPTLLCWRRAIRCVSPARTAAAAPSSTATPCCTTSARATSTSRCSTFRRSRPASPSSTPSCPRRRCWASSMATARPTPEALVHLGGAVRRLRQRRAGGDRPVHLRRRAEMAAADRPGADAAARLGRPGSRSTPPPAWSGSCRCARRRTCRCAIPARPSRCSTCCAARCCALPQAADHHDAQEPLRRKITFSTLEDLASGQFDPVISELDPLKPAEIKRVLLCSGKVYFDLLEARRERGITDIAIARVEQLYPFPDADIAAELKRYPKAAEVVWTQEEPQNQGAWLSIQDALRGCLQPGQTLGYAGRAPMAAPAGGDHHKHLERTKKMLNDALTLKVAPAAAGSRPGHA